MSGVSPSSVLFSSDGTELAVVANTVVPSGTRSLLIAGVNPLGKSMYTPASFFGQIGVASMANQAPLQVAATVTTSGSTTVPNYYFGTQEVALVVNVGTVTGSGSIQYTIQELDPGDNATPYGNTASTVVINTGNTPGVFTAVLNITTSSNFIITWTVVGTFSATIYSTLVSKETPATQTITGSITATNPSVGTDGAAALGFDTQVGAKVTTAAPTYTTGNLNALSLTTLGGLRIDGVYAGGTATGTATDQVVSGGYVTTAAPTYTTATLNALSLTTAGDLRVVANQGTSPWVTSVSGTVTVTGTTVNNQSIGADAATALGFDTQVGGKVTTAAPTYTTGNLDALSLTTLGGLRIDGVYAVGTANATAADVGSVGGYVTTAAPTYTTGQLNPLSLDTAGNLRVSGTVVTNKATTSSVTSVTPTSNANNVLLTATATRVFASVYNDTNKTIYIKCGTTASTASYTVQLFKGSYWEVPVDWTGELDAFAPASTTGNIVITELTP